MRSNGITVYYHYHYAIYCYITVMLLHTSSYFVMQCIINFPREYLWYEWVWCPLWVAIHQHHNTMATATDYPRYYGNGTGYTSLLLRLLENGWFDPSALYVMLCHDSRDSYIHANNGGLRNTSRTGDFRVHLRGGAPLLSDGSRLGGGIPLAAGIAGGARPIRLPTLVCATLDHHHHHWQ